MIQVLGYAFAIFCGALLAGVAIRAGWLLANMIFDTEDRRQVFHGYGHCEHCCPEPFVVPCFGCRGEKLVTKYDSKIVNTRQMVCDECNGRGTQTAENWRASYERKQQ